MAKGKRNPTLERAHQAYDLADEVRVQAEGLRFHLEHGRNAAAAEHARLARQRALEVLALLDDVVRALPADAGVARGVDAEPRERAAEVGA